MAPVPNEEAKQQTQTHHAQQTKVDPKGASLVQSLLHSKPSGGNAVDIQKKLEECKGCVRAFEREAHRQKRLASASTDATSAPPSEEPPSIGELGTATWTLIHTVAAAYPTNPTLEDQAFARMFFRALPRLYPCKSCAEDFQSYVESNPPNLQSNQGLCQWTCHLHNHVNQKLNKPIFDCSKYEERWGNWLE